LYRPPDSRRTPLEEILPEQLLGPVRANSLRPGKTLPAGSISRVADDIAPPSSAEVRAVLASVVDPELGSDIVDLGMLDDVAVTDGGVVDVTVALTVSGCPLRAQLRNDVDTRVSAIPGVSEVRVHFGEMDASRKADLMSKARLRAQNDQSLSTDLPVSARVLAVSSGKGGVGKSSVTVNLAVALARRGLRVGLLDADIWGFSVPRLLGMRGELQAKDRKIVPMELETGEGLLKVVSMGFLADEDTAIMWRGLILNRAVQQFLEDVRWGEVDYLLIDMPPGTGDIQMGLARMLPRTEVLVVTTPPTAAQKVAARAADMARKGHLRVAGVIENMSGFTCEHGESYPLFGEGGGRRLAEEIGAPLIGTVPIHPDMAPAGDRGQPVALGDGPLAQVFQAIAERVATDIAPVVEVSGCTARMLDRVEAALDSR
jgi:ATP-binding protein involved in chromosome partitioning